MNLTFQTFSLAFGLGLLGFIEPCTIGAHLIFVNRQLQNPSEYRLAAVSTFILARVIVMAGFGGAIVMLGQLLIGVQTGFWLVFGVLYLALGLFMIAGLDRILRRKFEVAPERWRIAGNPLLQGLAFGLNIPACAAPILFALIGTVAVTGSPVSGVVLMGTFALALSLPLLPLTVWPRSAGFLSRMADWLRARRWILGLVFILLGIWSIWFGLFVDPADWSGR
ncbi:sulfite exporter TauE/SafE family protein [Labrenzia sp. R4_2]|uniref:cytochrome c biogenesis CcdA family protein n=1 Tax=Labrenzia sp. R4_2 TaxID=2821107 RepID=UPI001AD99708|nr:cytochrome c biogenesis protein CcdA [Labrenzia sp. R4_2]MBO9422810.1 sulfite exporter TauE/SafE family protein [Labrenzia sp. R4_2]